MSHKTAAELQAGLADVLAAPRDRGTVRLIVRRPAVGQREVLESCRLDPTHGLVGDDWERRPASDGTPDLLTQLTIMNARYTELITGDTTPQRWAEAGDQFYLDLDISEANAPAGTRIRLGSAIVEISAQPHSGCAKFSARFGPEALRFANSSIGRRLRLRGANASVVEPGVVHSGDVVRRL